MATIKKVYDIVKTDTMMCEDVASLNFGEYKANTLGIENGRICELDHTTKKVKYVSDATKVADVYLSVGVENLYETGSLTNYINKSDKECAVKKIMLGDKFTTSAVSGTYADIKVGDVMKAKDTTGELAAKDATTPLVEFTVRKKERFGGLDCLYVERTK